MQGRGNGGNGRLSRIAMHRAPLFLLHSLIIAMPECLHGVFSWLTARLSRLAPTFLEKSHVKIVYVFAKTQINIESSSCHNVHDYIQDIQSLNTIVSHVCKE